MTITLDRKMRERKDKITLIALSESFDPIESNVSIELSESVGSIESQDATVPYPNMSTEGRTMPQTHMSGAKNCQESARTLRFYVAPQKPVKTRKMFVLDRKMLRKKNFWCEQIKCWEWSETGLCKV